MGGGRRWVGAGLAVVVVAIAVVVLAQGGDDGGGPLNAIAKAAEVTQQEPGGRAFLHTTITSSTTPEGATITGPMVFDDRGRAEGTLTIRGHSTGKAYRATEIVDGTTTYASSDAFDSISEGKKWIEVDLSSAVARAESSTAESPKEGLKMLEKVEGAEKLGPEEVNGVPTTHYRGTFPAAEEVFGVKVDTSDRHIDVWIDAQDRVRRIHVAVKSATRGAESSAASTEMTIDYVSFGRVPTIELPDPDEVFNVTGEIESNLQSIH
jgi:hypothetical protein